MTAQPTTPLEPLLPEPHVLGPTTPILAQVPPRPKGGRVKTWWAESRRDALADLKAARWGRGFLWFLLFLWGALVFGVTFAVPFVLGRRAETSSACRPDGSFSPYLDYSAWQISGFFQITVPFGSLTFTQAKAVDIIWDLVSVVSIQLSIDEPLISSLRW